MIPLILLVSEISIFRILLLKVLQFSVRLINAGGSFKFGFGGDIKVFPKARIFIKNTIYKVFYKFSVTLMKITPQLMQYLKTRILYRYL